MPTDREKDLARLGDVEVVDHMAGLIARIEDDDACDSLYFALDELLERFAPHVAAASRTHSIYESISDPVDRERELKESLHSIGERQSYRLMMRMQRYRHREGEDA